MSQYIRHAIAPMDEIVPEIMAQWDNPHARMTYGGLSFNIHSLRLKTFCRTAYKGRLECSTCKLRAGYFAVEAFARGDQTSVHINLYGRNSDGEEVLFTHDHTKARALGGADNLSNTTVMCFPCNNMKGCGECREVNMRRFMNGATAKARAHHQHLLDVRANPHTLDVVMAALTKWASTIDEDKFSRNIDTFLQQHGWKRKELKQKMNEGAVEFAIHPVKD